MVDRHLASFVLMVVVAVKTTQCVVVKTNFGVVQGQTHTLASGHGVNSFLGIPYAKPPIGELRFQMPEDPENWNETFVANRTGHACPQRREGLVWRTHIGYYDYNEDCLHLNIYTPQNITNMSYPVMVFIHGGGHVECANFQYPGYFLATYDIVVVSINYRLGALGFMSTGDAASPGNSGLWDQKKALEFIRDNIQAFGGDPGQVTLAGYSSGAADVGLHLISSQTKGLFKQAIFFGGSDLAPWVVQKEEHLNYTRQLANHFNCSHDSDALVECLRALDAEELAAFRFNCPKLTCFGFGPVVDGKSGFLPDTPLNLRKGGATPRTPVLMGETTNCGSQFLVWAFGDIGNGATKDQFAEDVKDFAWNMIPGEAEYKEGLFEALRFYYTPYPHVNDMGLNRDQLNYMVGDYMFRSPNDQARRFHCGVRGSKLYSYVFGYRSENSTSPGWMGAAHGADLYYVFGMPLLNDEQNAEVLQESGITIDQVPILRSWNAKDYNLSEAMMTLITNFVKDGQPMARRDWPIQSCKDLKYLSIDDSFEMKRNYRQHIFGFWRDYVPYLLGEVDPVNDTPSPSTKRDLPKTTDFSPLSGNSRSKGVLSGTISAALFALAYLYLDRRR